MFNKVVLPKMKFTIPQLINTEIAKNTKDVTRTAVAIPNQVGKRKPLPARKLLNGKIDINVSPQKDEVILSTASKAKETPNKTNSHSSGKTIKSVLAKYFDNASNVIIDAKEAKIFENKKLANLKNLVNEYETADLARHEKPSSYDIRLESLKIMRKEAKEKFIRHLEDSRFSYGEFVNNIKNGAIPSQDEIVFYTEHLK